MAANKVHKQSDCCLKVRGLCGSSALSENPTLLTSKSFAQPCLPGVQLCGVNS